MENNNEKLIKEGYTCYCPNCNTAYKEVPQEWYEDGHGGRFINMCKKCPCDLITNLKTNKLIS